MVRRVVTGHNDTGKAVFASDEEIELGNGVTGVWGADFEGLQYPDDGSRPVHEDELFPKVGGFRYVIVTLPPLGAETLVRTGRPTIVGTGQCGKIIRATSRKVQDFTGPLLSTSRWSCPGKSRSSSTTESPRL